MTRTLVIVAADCSSKICSLYGRAAQSATHFYAKVVKKFGNIFDNLVYLQDSSPLDMGSYPTSAANIRRVLQSRIQSLQGQDQMLFYFVGHGVEGSGETIFDRDRYASLVDDTHGLVASDLEIISAEWLSQLVACVPQTCTLTIITEACHSGGLIHGLRQQFGPEDSPIYEDASVDFQSPVIHLSCSMRKWESCFCRYSPALGASIGKYTRQVCKFLLETNYECVNQCRINMPPSEHEQHPNLYCTNDKMFLPCITLGQE